jgi:hypothetical protein
MSRFEFDFADEMRARAELRGIPLAADAVRVGRTHRVVRERAMAMRQSRRNGRSLLLPLGIASAMIALVCYALWTGLAQYDVAEISDELAGTLRGGSQMMIFGMWFLPVTATALVFAWLRRSRGRSGRDRI